MVLVHCAGVGHVLEDEIQKLPVTGRNGQLLLASALHHAVREVNEGVECPQRSCQGDLRWVKNEEAKCKERHIPNMACRGQSISGREDKRPGCPRSWGLALHGHHKGELSPGAWCMQGQFLICWLV